jgi:iron complex outermembrane recepter protein
VNAQYVSKVAVNDVNTAFAPPYAVTGADGGYGVQLRSVKLNVFARINNLLNRHYVGSVIVDDGNSRYFEPGPGSYVLGGFSATLQ